MEELKYPKRVFLICGYCLCERFAFYGTRALLSLYLNQILHYSAHQSTEIYHLFMVGCYFFPILGAIIADSWLGKFRTIVYTSFLYWVGNMTITVASASPLGFPQRETSLLGLFLIAFGTGTLKPCLSAFGGDQFLMPQQEKYLQEFFSVFYFAVNLGSLTSTSITPYIRHNVHCFNEHSCYSLAFGIPAVLMLMAIILILLGIRVYTMRKPKENMLVKVTCCISRAIGNKCCKGGEKKDHWLDHANDKYEQKFIEDVKLALRVLLLFVPIPLFWALFEQQGSRWTFQATHMNGAIGTWTQIEPEHMQVTNPLLVLFFIPLFDVAIYPALAKIGIYRPLQKISVGGLLTAISFVMSAILELALLDSYSVMPKEGEGHIRIYNSLNCQLLLDSKSDKLKGKLKPYESFELKDIKLKEINGISFTVATDCSSFEPSLKWTGSVKILEDKKKAAVSYVINGEPNVFLKGHIASESDNIKKSPNGHPKVRIVYSVKEDTTLKISSGDRKKTFDLKKTGYATDFKELERIYGTCHVSINGKDHDDIKLGYSGVYNIVIVENSKKYTVKLSQIQKPNTVHMLWQVPQYIVITFSEIMIAITGLELSYSQAPVSMKTVITAAWLLTNAFGNVIVVIVTKIRLKSQVFEFLLFAGLMVVVMCVFMVIAKFYTYVTISNEEE